MNQRLQALKYILSDLMAAAISWGFFYILRKILFESQIFGYPVEVSFDTQFYVGLIIIPAFWILLHYITGYYKDVYRKSRLKELGATLYISLLGAIIIFFVLILDDYVFSYKNYYKSFIIYYGLQFILTYIPRLIITTRTVHRIQNRIIGFRTLLVGSNGKALELYREMMSESKSAGNLFVGFAHVKEKEKYELEKNIPHLGGISDIPEIIRRENIEEVIIAIETTEQDKINSIIHRVNNKNVVVKVIPTLYDILTGSVKMTSIYSAPLIQISRDLLPEWQANVKRVIDLAGSVFALLILSPLYTSLAIGVKLSSPGPVFYSHERIGRFGKPFLIYKFRSMFVNAEANGPALSSKNDSRITRFGKFMRKMRLDELPQFYNVIKGEMSLVGPRPERQFFIDKIIERAPHYAHLQKVRPGITSWGQVKFGYAENVDEMIERLRYDLVYIENMSLYVDFKILIYTVLIIFQGRGK